ncbi:MAG: VIT1/CCC1 transporter family protein [Chloroflexi bacterium]|nr:VIT1/CCC1 transporter family protein [Chloroflexota bacterium]
MDNNNRKLIEGLRAAWKREIAGAKTYRALAANASSKDQREVLNRLAEAEERHAETWATRLRELGSQPPKFDEGPIDRARRWVMVQSGTESALRNIEAMEESDSNAYATLAASANEERDRVAVRATETEERAHGRLMSEMSHPVGPQAQLDSLMKREKWHVRGGGWIGQAIYGMNDGLGSVFGVVAGVAGATNATALFVIVSGIAAVIANAISMGAGAYLATKSEREVYEAELERERREMEMDPEQEREEMELFYQLKGFTPQESHELAKRMAERPEQMLKTLAAEELGLSAVTFPNPWREGLSAGIATAIGAFIPVIPFFFAEGFPAVVISFVISSLAYFVVGASKVLVTGRGWLRSGMEMMLIGLGVGLITYFIGTLFQFEIK